MRSSSRRKRFEVFELMEEDELLEASAARFLERFKPLAADRLDRVSKYEIIDCVPSNSDKPRKKTCVMEAPAVDIVALNGNPFEENGPDRSFVESESNAAEQLEPSRETALQFDLNGHGSQTFFPDDDQEPRHPSVDQDASSLGTFSDGKSHSSNSPSGSQSNSGAVDSESDADTPFDDQTSSKFGSDSEDNVPLDVYSARYSVDTMKVEDNDGTIVVCADYLTYKNKCYVQPLLVFSSNSVRVEYSASCEKGDTVVTSTKFKATTQMGTYLGFQLRAGGSNRQLFNSVVEKVRSRLAGWQTKLLSKASRIVVIKSVAEAIPAYQMQCIKLPVKIQKEIDKASRNFLWGSSNEQRKLHLVNWKQVTKSKDTGGLGLFDTQARNKALLAKLNWRIISPDKPLWSRVICAKYGEKLDRRKQGSCIYKALREGRSIAEQGLRKIVKSGLQTAFWNEDWLGIGKLRAHLIGPLNREEKDRVVADYYLLDTNTWERKEATQFLSDSIWEAIQQTEISRNSRARDIHSWKYSGDGEFNLSSAYTLAHNKQTSQEDTNLLWIWKLPTIPKHKTFIWQCWWNRLPTKDTLAHRQINADPLCILCQGEDETLLHLLRDCTEAKRIWHSLPAYIHTSPTQTLQEWLKQNLNSAKANQSTHRGIQWKVIFSTAIWNIWTLRNQATFNHQGWPPNPLQTILAKAAEIQAALGKKSKHRANRSTPSSHNNLSINPKWKPSQSLAFTLNTDASVTGNSIYAGIGGLIRDDRGKWIGGFYKKLANMPSLTAEAKALYQGLLLAKELHLKHIEAQTDSALLVLYMLGKRQCPPLISPVVDSCRCLSSDFENFEIKHIPREENEVADKLAKEARTQEDYASTLLFPPDFVLRELHRDIPYLRTQ